MANEIASPDKPRFGGRKPGSKNRATKDVRNLLNKVFKRVDIIAKIEALLNSNDPRVQANVILRLMEYRFGKPQEKLEISGGIDMHAVVQKARERVLRLEAYREALPKPPVIDAQSAPTGGSDATLAEQADLEAKISSRLGFFAVRSNGQSTDTGQ